LRLSTFGHNTGKHTIMSQILLVGPRASGKLTFLSGLAGWKAQQKYNSKVRIETSCEDSKRLGEFWEDIICQQERLSQTDFNQKTYHFSLNFSIPRFFKDELQRIDLIIANVAGEVFEMSNSEGWKFYQEYRHTSLYITQELTLIMIMIDCSMYRFDEEYAGNINELIKYYLTQNPSMTMCRIALVISQFDALDVWVNRKNTNKVMNRFKQVQEVLIKNAAEQDFRWKPFVNSTFGGLGRDYMESNTIFSKSYMGRFGVLKSPSVWKPYGLFSPLYWLCTGKDLNGIDYY
jgi:hypothetical protein